MAEPNTKSTPEQGRTTGSNPGSAVPAPGQGAGPSGHSVGSTGSQGSQGSSATGQARARTPEPTSGQAGSTMERGAAVAGQAKQTVSDAYNRASQSVNDTWDQALNYSRQNPGTATLIAFGAGVGVGLLLAGRISSRSRTQRLVPPILNALSDIASEIFR